MQLARLGRGVAVLLGGCWWVCGSPKLREDQPAIGPGFLHDLVRVAPSQKERTEERCTDTPSRYVCLRQESAVSTSKNVNKALEDLIVELVDVDIPETLIDEQTKTKFANMMSDFKEKGMDDAQVKSMITKENFEKYKKTSYDNTVRSLRISFVIGEIAKKEAIKIDPSELEGEMANIRQQYAGEEIDEEQARSRVEAELERKKVLEFLKSNNSIKLVPKKVEEPKA